MTTYVYEIETFGLFDEDIAFVGAELYSSLDAAKARVEGLADCERYRAEWHDSEYGHSCKFKLRGRRTYAPCSFLIVKREVIE